MPPEETGNISLVATSNTPQPQAQAWPTAGAAHASSHGTAARRRFFPLIPASIVETAPRVARGARARRPEILRAQNYESLSS